MNRPQQTLFSQTVFSDEVDIDQFEYNPETQEYVFPCPCGDYFVITLEELENEEIVAQCPSCSLIIKVIYDPSQFKRS
ncbi:diphthamide biosynthesis protein 3 [Nematocida sp. AWRm80]|nr:diphthamide biosynthesis protein 3 [Nematocida sp. AWRm80]